MDLSVPAEPVQDGAEPLNDAMEEEVRPAEETQEREQDTPSTLPPPPPAPQDAAAVAASSEVMQEATIEPAIAPVTSPPVGPDNAVGPTTSDGAAAEREEQNATPVPASTTISTPTPTTPVTPTPKPRPVLQGTLIGLFVAIDPATQRGKVNVKRELEFMGIYQRDLTPKEEVQLSLEQAFYLVADLKRLEVYLPAPPPLVQEAEEQQQQQQQVEPREDAMEQGNGEAGQEQEQEQQQKQEGVAAAGTKEDAEPKALSMVECWKAFRTASSTYVKSVGSYRYFREQGFVVHGGLNLGLDFMLYRGTPQKYHAEFGVLLRYPPSLLPSSLGGEEGEEGGGGGGEGVRDENGLSWRDLHLLYRLIGEVRKTLILGHVRLGKLKEEKEEDEVKKEGEEGSIDTTEQPNNNEKANGEEGEGEENEEQEKEGEEEKGGEQEEAEDQEARREMQQWYTGLSVYEVAVTPWRAGTPLARLKLSKQKGTAAQVKRGGGQGGQAGGGKKRGRGGAGEGGGGGRGSGAEEEGPADKRQHV